MSTHFLINPNKGTTNPPKIWGYTSTEVFWGSMGKTFMTAKAPSGPDLDRRRHKKLSEGYIEVNLPVTVLTCYKLQYISNMIANISRVNNRRAIEDLVNAVYDPQRNRDCHIAIDRGLVAIGYSQAMYMTDALVNGTSNHPSSLQSQPRVVIPLPNKLTTVSDVPSSWNW
jgi:hypothetical protein